MLLEVIRMDQKQASVDGILALFIVVIGMLLMMVGFNYKTIVLSLKGYEPSQIALIMDMESNDQALIFNQKCLKHIDWWMRLETDPSLYWSYENLLEMYPQLAPEEIKAIYDISKKS